MHIITIFLQHEIAHTSWPNTKETKQESSLKLKDIRSFSSVHNIEYQYIHYKYKNKSI